MLCVYKNMFEMKTIKPKKCLKPIKPKRISDQVFEQIDRNAKSLLQSALTRLDVVSREEFDAQAAVLKRTRERLEALEAQIAALDEALSASERQGDH